jgi:hypothetical protein
MCPKQIKKKIKNNNQYNWRFVEPCYTKELNLKGVHIEENDGSKFFIFEEGYYFAQKNGRKK